MSLPSIVRDLPRAKFPFTIEAFGPDGEEVWSIEVPLPTAGTRRPVQIPGTGPGSVARVRMRFADGEVIEHVEVADGE